MRYYFHFESRNERISDCDGAELADLQSAHRHALRIIEQAAPVIPSDDPNWRDWRIEVGSGTGDRVLTVLTAASQRLSPLEPRRAMRVFGRRKRFGATRQPCLTP
jgi:hypothetical protein